MDNELAESVQALKSIFEKRFVPANFAPGDKSAITAIARQLSLPERYMAFLVAADPQDVETVTPTERVRFIPAAELPQEQIGYGCGDEHTPKRNGWRPEWVVIAHSAMLGDPYFIDTSRADAEGDCPVLTAMSGTGSVQPLLCASTFATFIEILATAMSAAEGFSEHLVDPDDEHIFRESLEPKIRQIDPAALREGHWTR